MGQGKTMKEAMDEVKMVVEGVYSAKAGYQLSKKYNIYMPIITEVNAILFEDKKAIDAFRDIMERDAVEEHSSLNWD